MQTLFSDLRFAVRTLLKQPVFTLVALATLALGIGANTAVFSLIETVFLRPLPYPDADRLMTWQENNPGFGDNAAVSCPRYDIIREQQDVFESMGAVDYDGFTLTGRGEPAQLYGCHVTANFLQTLGVRPAQGRLFSPGEDQPGGPRIVVLSYACWQRRFAGDPGVVGQSINLNNVPHTVVGVLAAPLTLPFDQTDVLIPNVLESSQYPPAMFRQGSPVLLGFARLKPGVSRGRADQELGLIAARYRQVYPDHVDAKDGLRVAPFQELVIGDSRPMFYTLAGAVSCVLLIACVNVANLLLAQLAGRRKEIAVRAALGANRWRLARQFLTESLVLTLLAGTLGVLLAMWCIHLARSLGTDVIPRAAEIQLSGTTLAWTLVISLGTGLFLGVAPALHAARGNAGDALQQADSRGSSGGVRQGKTRAVLLIAQVALSLVLLAGTGLLLGSLWRLQKVRMGFNPDGVVQVDVNLPGERYPKTEQQADFFARLTARLDALPGVQRSAAAVYGPMAGALEMFYSVVGQPVAPDGPRLSAFACYASPDYFATLQIPILRGRGFTALDRTGAPPVMLMSQAMAERLFPGMDPIGQRLMCTASDPTLTEIVGIVADARTVSLAKVPRGQMYFSIFQRAGASVNVYVRTTQPQQARTLGPAIRAAVEALDSDQPVGDLLELDTLVSHSLGDRRLMALLLASFAGLALVLAAIGVYGVTAYGVAQRTREIGIRMALGAGRNDVFRLIVGGGMKLIAVGIAVGLVSALGLTRLLASRLYGVGASDPLTFAAVVLLLVAVALLANYLPARRATRLDPLTALREE